MHRNRLFGGVVLAALMLVGFTSVASAQAPLPVPNAFLAGVPQELGNPGGSAPGSNDFSCRPTAEHPNPVVLVHGTGGNRQTNWATYAPLLANEGYCVFALTYGNFPEQPWPLSAIGGMQEIPSSAAQLSNFVDQVLDATGATSVDLIGHSQAPSSTGTTRSSSVVPTKWTTSSRWRRCGRGRSETSRQVSAAASRTRGIRGSAGRIPDLQGMSEHGGRLGVHRKSPCGRRLRAGCSLHEHHDPLRRTGAAVYKWLEPGPNATNIVVQDGCEQDISDHLAIAASLRAATFALNALDPAHQRPVPCNSVLPVVG